jgi:hypothetical protein
MESNAAAGPLHPGNSISAQGIEGEIQRLIASDKCKQAVELAKNHHKQVNTPESQRLLVHTYLARIEQFQNKHMIPEAQTLLNLVQERFPAERYQLRVLEIRAAAAAGRIHDLLRPLASEQTSPEIRAVIESAVARYVTDLPAVAACDALPAEHPLRTGAAAVWHAFLAVTRGPVADADFALAEISHRSPLAAWKLLIRAIAAFYRQDDSGCRRALDGIAADSAVGRVAAAVRALVDGKKPAAGVALAIYNRVRVDDEALLAAMRKIESSYPICDLSRLTSGIREAVRECAQSRPELLERLRQHISAACALHDVPVGEVRKVLGHARKDAYFWRLLARATESHVAEAINAMYWERFLRHAVHEGMFEKSSVEAATIWLHIAELLSHLSLRDLDRDRNRVIDLRLISEYYDGQPSEFAVLRPESDRAVAEDVLTPGRAFQHAAMIRPDAETFRQWWAWAQRVELRDKLKEDIALQWMRARPQDAQAPLILASLAESRKAYAMAIKRVAQAEALDPLNRDVRKARLRLTLSITWRHFDDGKAHLVEKDIAELAALPGMNEGDRAAVLESIRGAWHSMRGDEAAAAACFQTVMQRVGSLAGSIVFNSIKKMTTDSLRHKPIDIVGASDAQPVEIAQTQARIIRLADDLLVNLSVPLAWAQVIADVLRLRPCPLSIPDVLSLGRGSIVFSEPELAYLASSAGLIRAEAPAVTARFLLLRANSLNETWQRPRTAQCLRAALELARQAHDEDLIRDVFALIDRDKFTRRLFAGRAGGMGLSNELLRQILDKEQSAEAYPGNHGDITSSVVRPAEEEVMDPFADFAAPQVDWDTDDDDDEVDADDEDDGGGLFDFDSAADPETSDGRDRPSAAEFAKVRGFLQGKGVESQEQLLRNPRLLIEALSHVMGYDVPEAVIDAMATELNAAMGDTGPDRAGGPFGGRSKKHKRRRGYR